VVEVPNRTHRQYILAASRASCCFKKDSEKSEGCQAASWLHVQPSRDDMIGYGTRKGHGPFLVSKIKRAEDESFTRTYESRTCRLAEAGCTSDVKKVFVLSKMHLYI
jgi:hypothetical protein